MRVWKVHEVAHWSDKLRSLKVSILAVVMLSFVVWGFFRAAQVTVFLIIDFSIKLSGNACKLG